MPPTKNPQTFDQYAKNYQQLLNRSVSISGEGGEYFARVKAAYVSTTLGLEFSGRILDFGCGVGMLSHALKRQFENATVDGYDSSAVSIAAVNRDLKASGHFTSSREQVVSDYQAIVVANVLHHVAPAERDSLMQFVSGHLAPGGRLFVFEHNPANPITRLAVDRCPFDEDAILLTLSEAQALLYRAGFSEVHRDYIVFFPKLLKMLRPLECLLGWCPAGAQYVVRGVKP